MKIGNEIIAAVRTKSDFYDALESGVNIIFELSPDILTIGQKIRLAHESGKRLFVHLDLAEGIGKDRLGIEYLKQLGIDGIISTRLNIIKAAKDAGLFAVQRFFILDSQSLNTTAETFKATKADMIEIMPGTVYKVIRKLSAQTATPIIAGGLIDTASEAEEAFLNGAAAVSAGKKSLWPKRISYSNT